MADHDTEGRAPGAGPTGDDLHAKFSNSHAGRPKSWAAVTIMTIGFLVSGVALCVGPSWWLFWVGCGIVVLGGIFALLADIWNDVVVDEPRRMPEQPHRTPLHHGSGDDELRRRGLDAHQLAGGPSGD